MRLASYLVDGQPRAGVVASDQTLVAVSDLIAGGPSDTLAVLAAGPSLWDRLRAAAPSARGGQALSKELSTGVMLEPGDVVLTGMPGGRWLRARVARVFEGG